MDINELRKLTGTNVSESALQAALDEQTTSASLLKAAMDAASRSTFSPFPVGIDYLDRMPTIPKIINIWDTQAKLFMEGLKSQVEELEANLKPNQELVMTCWHGHEQFQVLSVSMPSKNVVALNCRDSEGDVSQVTGHMNSVTFSFRIVTAKEPVQRRRIGFDLPSGE
jgi:hypothetical protein